MKVIVLNYPGGVGKTIITDYLLSPRMGNTPIIVVGGDNDAQVLLGNRFKDGGSRKLFIELFLAENVVVDVAASNAEIFLGGMNKFNEAHSEYDYFIVPVTNGTKEQRETMAMIGKLAALGIPPDKIRLLFNRVESSVEDEFHILLDYVAKNNNATANPDAAIFDTELFDVLVDENFSMKELLDDTTDYKAMLLNNKAKDPEIREYCGGMLGLILLARATERYLDDAYVAVFENP